MTDTASHSVPEQGKFRRVLAAVWAFLQAMESTSFDYTLDRIERLEREVGRLKEELRQSRDPGAVDAYNASAAARER
jgi:HAMP domain-containing protein